MANTSPNDDLDKIDGRTFVAWLIYTGAGAMIASMPASIYYGFIDAFDSPPEPVYDTEDFLRIMSSEMMLSMMPMLLAVGFAGAIAALMVLMARGNTRLHGVIVVLLAGIGGLLAGMIALPDSMIALVTGGVTGLLSGAAMTFARRLLIRGG